MTLQGYQLNNLENKPFLTLKTGLTRSKWMEIHIWKFC